MWLGWGTEKCMQNCHEVRVHWEKSDGDDMITFISFYVETVRALLRIMSSGDFDICGEQAAGWDTAALFS